MEQNARICGDSLHARAVTRREIELQMCKVYNMILLSKSSIYYLQRIDQGKEQTRTSSCFVVFPPWSVMKGRMMEAFIHKFNPGIWTSKNLEVKGTRGYKNRTVHAMTSRYEIHRCCYSTFTQFCLA